MLLVSVSESGISVNVCSCHNNFQYSFSSFLLANSDNMRQISRASAIISFPVSFGDIPLPISFIGFSFAGVLLLSNSAILKR